MVTKYPLAPRAVALAAGIAAAGFSWPLNVVVVGFALTAAIYFRPRIRWAGAVAWFGLGVMLLTVRMLAQGPDDLRSLFGAEPELVTVRGVVKVDPEQRVLDRDGKTRYRTTARVRVEEVEWGAREEKACGDVAVSTTGYLPEEMVAGARVEVFGVLERPQGPLAPGLFDFERYLKWQRVFFVLRAEHTNDWKLLKAHRGWSGARFYRGFNEWARATLQRGLPDDEISRLLRAMALGWKPGLSNEVSEPFMRTGTAHVFAISGLHIAMMAWMLVKALGKVGLSRNWAGFLALPIIWFYTGATGWQASAVRSTIMSSVVIVGWMLRRPNNLLNSLAASAILILLWQAEQFFQPGFQLSFLLLLTMAVWPALAKKPWPDPTLQLGQREAEAFEAQPEKNAWARGLARIYEWVTGRDPMLPEEFRPWWRRQLDTPVAWLMGGLNLSLASLVCSLPITAAYFNLVSFSSLIANLLVVPLSGIALGGSMASLVTGWLPWIPEVANWIAWAAMWAMVEICRALENFSWAFMYVEAPGAPVIIVYFVAVACVLTGWIRNWRVAVPLAIAGLVLLVSAIHRETKLTRVIALPGSGVVFIDAPWSKNDVLVDCGREREAMSIVKPFLRSRGVDRLATIVLTHGDVEHVDGYVRLSEEFRVKQTVTSAAKSRSPRYRAVLKFLDEDRHRVVSTGEEVSGWKVLHPGAGEDFAKADDEAIVLQGVVGKQRVLLMSDLGRLGQDRLAERVSAADIVICGRSVPEVLRPALMEKLKPKTVVLTGNVPKVPEIGGVRVMTTQKAVVVSSESF